MPEMTSVSLGVWIGTGGRYEEEGNSGISHLIEHMLFKGTEDRDARALKQSVEGIGGSFNGFTSDEVTCYMVKVPYKHFSLGMEILSDMVLHPKFDEEELAREKFVVCEEIKMYRDQPSDHVMDLLAGLIWPDSSLGRPLTGKIRTVKGFSREDLIDFKRKNYHAGNTSVIVCGNIKPRRVADAVRRHFSELREKKPRLPEPVRVSLSGPRVKVTKSLTKQAHIAMGFPVNMQSVKDRFAVKLMNIILGGNMSSRLFEHLRENKGLCYDVSSTYKRHSDAGEVHVHAGVDSRRSLLSIKSINEEIRVLKNKMVSEEELYRAKEFIKGQFLLALEGTATRMLWLGDRLMVHGRIPPVDSVLENINRVTSADVQKAARDLFQSRIAHLALIGSISAAERAEIVKDLRSL
jgi:predicted Zn-dependent peptidase